MSFTISYSNPPCGGQDLLNNTSPAFIGAQNNNFTVSQSMAGLSSSALVSSSAGFTVSSGVISLPSASISDSALTSNVPLKNSLNTFSQIQTFSSPPVMSGSSIASASIPAGSIVADSLTDGQIATGGIGQTSVASGYVDLVNAQSVAGVKTFSSPPVMSGSSISFNTIPALSIVNDSLGDAQISTGGIGQTSVASGYVDLSTAQTVAGVKTFSSGISGILTGSLVGNADSATVSQTVNIQTDNTAGVYFIPFLKTNGATSDSLFVDDVSVPVLSYNPSTGAFTAGSIVSSAGITCGGLTSTNGLVVSSGNISLQSGIIRPVAQTTLSLVAGVLTINLNSLSFNEFILPSANFTANITSVVFTNAIVNATFNIYIQGGAVNRTVNKALGAGQVNNLAGNTQFAALSTWRCVGKVLSSTLVALDLTNYT